MRLLYLTTTSILLSLALNSLSVSAAEEEATVTVTEVEQGGLLPPPKKKKQKKKKEKIVTPDNLLGHVQEDVGKLEKDAEVLGEQLQQVGAHQLGLGLTDPPADDPPVDVLKKKKDAPGDGEVVADEDELLEGGKKSDEDEEEVEAEAVEHHDSSRGLLSRLKPNFSRFKPSRDSASKAARFFGVMTMSAVEWFVIIVSSLLCIKASPRIIQSVFMQMHTDFGQVATLIYSTAIGLVFALPLLISIRKGERVSEWIVPNRSQLLAILQGVVAVTTVFVWEEGYSVSKKEHFLTEEFYKFRWVGYLSVFFLSTYVSYYVFRFLKTYISRYFFVLVSLFNTGVLAGVLIWFDKTWRPTVDEVVQNAKKGAEQAYNSAHSYVGSFAEANKQAPPSAPVVVSDLTQKVEDTVTAAKKQAEDLAEEREKQEAQGKPLTATQ